MKIIYKNPLHLPLALSLALAPPARALESTGTRGGGKSVLVDGRQVLKDIQGGASCDWQEAPLASDATPTFRRIIQALADLNLWFALDFETKLESISVCFTASPLEPINTADPSSALLRVDHDLQAAVREGNTVYVNRVIYDAMDEPNRAFLLFHEVAQSLFEASQQDRNLHLRSFVNATYRYVQGQIDLAHYKYQAQKSDVDTSSWPVQYGLSELRSLYRDLDGGYAFKAALAAGKLRSLLDIYPHRQANPKIDDLNRYPQALLRDIARANARTQGTWSKMSEAVSHCSATYIQEQLTGPAPELFNLFDFREDSSDWMSGHGLYNENLLKRAWDKAFEGWDGSFCEEVVTRALNAPETDLNAPAVIVVDHERKSLQAERLDEPFWLVAFDQVLYSDTPLSHRLEAQLMDKLQGTDWPRKQKEIVRRHWRSLRGETYLGVAWPELEKKKGSEMWRLGLSYDQVLEMSLCMTEPDWPTKIYYMPHNSPLRRRIVEGRRACPSPRP